MASSSVQERSGVITPVPQNFVVEVDKIEMKPNNFLPLLNIPKGKEYYLEANFLISGPAKTALMLSVPAVKSLFFNLWATALVVAGETQKGIKYEYFSSIKYEYVSGFLPSKTNDTKLEEFSFTLRDFRDVLRFPAKPADTSVAELVKIG